MTFHELSRLARVEIDRTVADLPPDVRRAVQDVPVFLERFPDAADVETGIAPDTLGFFDDGAADSPTPRIRLWLENIFDYAEGDEAAFLDEVRTTLLHEIGHFLGWDEDDVEERGLA